MNIQPPYSILLSDEEEKLKVYAILNSMGIHFSYPASLQDKCKQFHVHPDNALTYCTYTHNRDDCMSISTGCIAVWYKRILAKVFIGEKVLSILDEIKMEDNYHERSCR